ncbi:alpha/beta hydrolase [Konateibacter massiliensis]|uniref:alpha/beta hydrolase n=1 Tax=Konateibacter massiliensis TaxID=2002841 RepID=UPI000C15ABD5|nr:alpha/beta hydrolase [Konateibacter massiliensis]
MKKKLIIGSVSAAIALLASSYFFVGNYFYNLGINAHTKKDFLDGNPDLESTDKTTADEKAAKKALDAEFIRNNPPASLSITSDDELHLKLHADLFANGEDNPNWAIVVHGYSGENDGMYHFVRMFYEKGYQVLAPDLRGHGESEGDYIGMGWDDRLDMVSWINEIVKINPDAKIVLLGVSMGGATVMNTSGEDLPSNVRVIVEDCGFTSTGDIFTYQLKQLYGLPKFPVMAAANTVAKIRAGYDIFDSSAIGQVAKSKTPMLFIHGDKDTFVPYEMLDQVYEVATVEKEKLVIEGAGHGEAEAVNPDLYWKTVWAFTEKYMK